MDTLSVDLEITDGNADAVISKTKQKLGDFIADVEKKQPTIKFSIAGESFIDLDKLEQKAEETRRRFQEIATVRLNNGQINGLTRDIVSASERSRQLSFDIANIKKELASPNRKSSIAFLTDELKAAESEAAQLERKLSTIQSGGSGDPASRAAGAGRRSLLQNGQLRGAGPLFRASGLYQYGLDESILNAGIRGNEYLAGTAAGGVSAAGLATFGALAVAGVAVVEASKNVRSEAERRLAAEDLITGTINKQILGLKELTGDYERLKQLSSETLEFNKTLETLIANRDKPGLKTVYDKTDAGNKQLLNQISSLKADIYNTEQNAKLVEQRPVSGLIDQTVRFAARADPSLGVFVQHDAYGSEQEKQSTIKALSDKAEKQKKDLAVLQARLEHGGGELNQANAALFGLDDKIAKDNEKTAEKDRKEQEKFIKSVEEGKTKVEQLQKTWTAAFDSLFQRTSGDNPFAAFLAKSQTEADKLKESLKGLDPALQKVALSMQQVASSKDLFAVNLDNKIAGFNLRRDANNFRNPYDANKVQNDKNAYRQRFLADNPNYLYLNQGKSPGEIDKDIFGGTSFDDPNRRLNSDIDSEYNIIYNRKQQGFDQAAADKKFIDVTNGVNPLDLTDSNRDAAASAREREASRRERFEADAQNIRREQLAVQKQIVANTSRLNEIAEKGGKAAIDLTLKNETGNDVTAKAATPDDVDAHFSFDLYRGSNR